MPSHWKTAPWSKGLRTSANKRTRFKNPGKGPLLGLRLSLHR
nr:MAG TPA: hypothetical protein [Caudoviricetes sp.]